MKKKLLLCLSLIAGVGLHAQITWKTQDLKGRILMVKTTSYEFVEKFGELERGDHQGSTSIFFDAKGYATKTFSFYNQNEGRDDTSKLTTYNYGFNESNQLREINELEGYRTLNYKTKFKYSPEGKLLEKNIYNSDGSLYERYIYKEEDGKLIEKQVDEQGEVVSPFEMEEEVEEVVTYKIAEIDSNGNWIKKLGFKNGKQVIEITRKIIYY
jgi:hypothetical protein